MFRAQRIQLQRLKVEPESLLVVLLPLFALFLWSWQEQTRGARLILPVLPVEVQAASDPLPPSQLVVRARGTQLTLNGAEVQPTQLEERLKVLLELQKDKVVFVDLDPAVRYDEALQLLEPIQRAGAHSVALTPDLTTFLPAATTPAQP
ncbi:MAG: ExbD/TolR family protein [Myxococcota bacterium]